MSRPPRSGLASRAAGAARLGVTLGGQLAGGALGVVRSTAGSLLDSVGRAVGLAGEPHPYERAARAAETVPVGVRSARVRFEHSTPVEEELGPRYAEALQEDLEAADEAVDDDRIGALDEELEEDLEEALEDERIGALAEELGRAARRREEEELAAAPELAAEEQLEAAPELDAAERPEPGVKPEAVEELEPEAEAADEPLAGSGGTPVESAGRPPAGAGDDGGRAPAPERAGAAAPREPVAPAEDHVDTGAALVGEFAEAGAEEGAGAEVEVAEPWEGYAGMTAAEVRRRLVEAAPATLTAVTLYEGAHRSRKSVLEDAQRRLARGAAGP